MNQILKTFILSPSDSMWLCYRENFKRFFEGRSPQFDAGIELIEMYQNRYGIFPSMDSLEKELTISGEMELLSFLQGVCSDPGVEIYPDTDSFVSGMRIIQKVTMEQDVFSQLAGFNNSLSAAKNTRFETVVDQVEGLMASLASVRDKARSDSQRSASALLFGPEACQEFRDLYTKNENLTLEGSGGHYFDLGIPGFESLQLKLGDLVTIGGFQSHGKSLLLRQIAYHLLTRYGLNVLFLSFEMFFNSVLAQFHIRHANNKMQFPGTPYVSYDRFKNGVLQEDEKNFLLGDASSDLVNNPNYGTLYLEEPCKGEYRVSDLLDKLRYVEDNYMPIHVVAVDYITLMHPFAQGSRAYEVRSAYNQMIKTLKNHALSHTDRKGARSPFLLISPVQISRHGLDDALKNDGKYDVSAIKDYSEIETSSDVILTTLIDSEMREDNKLRVQNLKYRDGKMVVDPKDFYCHFDRGGILSTIESRSQQDMIELIQRLQI